MRSFAPTRIATRLRAGAVISLFARTLLKRTLTWLYGWHLLPAGVVRWVFRHIDLKSV